MHQNGRKCLDSVSRLHCYGVDERRDEKFSGPPFLEIVKTPGIGETIPETSLKCTLLADKIRCLKVRLRVLKRWSSFGLFKEANEH